MSGSSRGSSEMTRMKRHRLGWAARVEEHEVSSGKGAPNRFNRAEEGCEYVVQQ